MDTLTFITGNAAKAQFLRDYLKIPITHHKLDLAEIQSLNLQEVVEDKARRAYDILKSPVLVEDSSLEITALHGLPGPLVKWFYEALGNAGMCRLLNAADTREAITRCMFALYDGQTMHIFEGDMEGSIAQSPQGESGFGFDPIFIVKGYKMTRAEMDKDIWAQTSMRTKALEKMHKYFESSKTNV